MSRSPSWPSSRAIACCDRGRIASWRVSELWERDAYELADAVRGGEVLAAELLDVHLERIERLDGRLNCVCYLDVDAARARAAEVDNEVAAGGDPGALAGVPIGVKELASVAGWPETHASVVFADRVATFRSS